MAKEHDAHIGLRIAILEYMYISRILMQGMHGHEEAFKFNKIKKN